MSEAQTQVLVIKQMFDESTEAFELRVKQAHQEISQTPVSEAAPAILYSVPLPASRAEPTTHPVSAVA